MHFPWVEIPHLASHLLARMTRMLSGEWERAYGHPICFVETFIDPERFRGTCYRAANWTVLGFTTGRGKNAWSKRPNRPIKEVLGYPLHFLNGTVGSLAPGVLAAPSRETQQIGRAHV